MFEAVSMRNPLNYELSYGSSWRENLFSDMKIEAA